jgi:hypothetical protein
MTFDPTLLTAGGADNGWLPTPTERVQIAYGVDSRVQSLLAVADVGRVRAARDLAVLEAAWFFGANRSGEPMYDPATGVTFDGLEADGRINRNSGAESTIHGLLTMLALDERPDLRSRAMSLTSVPERDGLRLVEAETASTNGTVVTPPAPWTGESLYSGGYLELDPGETATLDLGASGRQHLVEPVAWLEEGGTARSTWRQGDRPLGTLRHRVGEQGITAVPGALLPGTLDRTVRPAAGPVHVRAARGTVRLDALLVRPLVSRMSVSGPAGAVDLVHSASTRAEQVRVGSAGERAQVRVYDHRGRLLESRWISGAMVISLRPGGLAFIATP